MINTARFGEITKFSIIGIFVIEFDCNVAIVDVDGVMHSMLIVVLIVVFMLEIVGVFLVIKEIMIIMVMLEMDQFMFVLFAMLDGTVIGIHWW